MSTIFHVQNVPIILNWCLCDFLVWKHIDEVYALHLHFLFIDVDFFFVENVPEFQYCFWLFTDIDYFSCAKCSYHFRLMFMWFSCTETYSWSTHSPSSFVIYWCCVVNVPEFQYCFWLFTDVNNLWVQFLGGLSLHLNHLIESRMTNYNWPFGTLPFGLFGSNMDRRDLETYPRTYSGHF